MLEGGAALLPLCSLQAPPHRAGRGPTGLFRFSVLEEAAVFCPPWGMSLRLLGGILHKCLPSNGWPPRDPGGNNAVARELGQEAAVLALALGQTLAPAGTRRWPWGAPCPALGHGCGATAWGRAGPVPSNVSLSSWMSVLLLIKTKSIFFCRKKRHCSGEHFPQVSSPVSAARA